MDATSKWIAVAAVVIIVVAAVGAYAFIDKKDSGGKTPTTMGLLQVYGNANADKSIDSEDVNLIQEIIDKDLDWKTLYPFADADRNNKVDADDIALVQKIINRESCEISYIDGRDIECKVGFPVDRFVIAGTMVHPVINALGATDKAVGKTGKASSLDPVLNAPSINLFEVSAKAYSIDPELLSKVGQVDAVFTLYSSTYDEIDEGLAGTGIPSVRINSEAMDKTVQAYLLIGLLTGTVEKSHKIVDFYDKYSNDIASKVASISVKKTAFACQTYSMCGVSYYLTQNIIAAGLTNLSDFTENTKKLNEDNEWALVDKYQGDYIIQFNEMNYSWTDEDSATAEYDKHGKYYTAFDAYKAGNYILINKSLSDIVRVAFVASVIYPEVFGEDYGYNILKEQIDLFYPYMENYDVYKDGKWVITYDEAHPSS